MDQKKVRELIKPLSSQRSNGPGRLNSLPRIFSHATIHCKKEPKTKPRSCSVKKPFNLKYLKKVINRPLAEADAMNHSSIDEDISRLNELAIRNQVVRSDWLNVQQKVIEMNANNLNYVSENFYVYKPLNLKKIIERYSSRKILQPRSSNCYY